MANLGPGLVVNRGKKGNWDKFRLVAYQKLLKWGGARRQIKEVCGAKVLG